MSNSITGKALLIMGMTAALGVGALAFYVKNEPGAAKVDPHQTYEQSQDEPLVRVIHERSSGKGNDDAPPPSKALVTVMLPKISGSEATLASESSAVPSGEDPLTFVAKACLKEARVEGAEVLGVTVSHKAALVNFNKAIEDGMGSEQEGSFLKSLQLAYGQFPNINQVEILREGSPLTSLGSLDLPGPMDVIRSEPADSQSSKPSEP
jgi:hypothetical protein